MVPVTTRANLILSCQSRQRALLRVLSAACDQRWAAVQINKSFHQFCQKVDTEIWERDYP